MNAVFGFSEWTAPVTPATRLPTRRSRQIQLSAPVSGGLVKMGRAQATPFAPLDKSHADETIGEPVLLPDQGAWVLVTCVREPRTCRRAAKLCRNPDAANHPEHSVSGGVLRSAAPYDASAGRTHGATCQSARISRGRDGRRPRRLAHPEARRRNGRGGEFPGISPGTGAGSPPLNANAGIAIGKMAKAIRHDRRRIRRSNWGGILFGRLGKGAASRPAAADAPRPSSPPPTHCNRSDQVLAMAQGRVLTRKRGGTPV